MPRKAREVVVIAPKPVTRRDSHGVAYKRWLVWTSPRFGQRLKRYCATYAEAQSEKDILLADYNQRIAGLDLSDRSFLLDANEAKKLINGRTNLIETAKFWLLHHPIIESPPFPEAIETYLLAKEEEGLKEDSLGPLRFVLRRVASGFLDKKVAEVSRDALEAWFKEPTTRKKKKPRSPVPLSINNKRNYLRDLNQFFKFCVTKKWVISNPISEIKRPKQQREEPEFYTIEETLKLLKAAVDHPELEMLGVHVLAFFSGIRIRELGRMQWGMVDVKEKEIRLPTWVTKTGHPRNIVISRTLLAWLPLVKIPEDGKTAVMLKGRPRRTKRDKLHELADVPLKGNALRHTFATYHAAWHRKPGELQLILGQKTPSVLFDHYVAATSQRIGKKFFELRPADLKDKP